MERHSKVKTCEICGQPAKNRFCAYSCYWESLIGHVQSKEQIEKRSLKNRGKKRTEEQKAKLSKSMTGIKKIVHHDKQFKKGMVPWNKGMKMSLDFCNKIRNLNLLGIVGMTGKHHSEESKEKIKRANWTIEGGIYPEDLIQRKKFARDIQKKVFERDSYTCKECGKKGGFLQVDHKKSWAKYKDQRFDLDNCQTLCMSCHYKKTYGKDMPKGLIWGHNLSRVGG